MALCRVDSCLLSAKHLELVTELLANESKGVEATSITQGDGILMASLPHELFWWIMKGWGQWIIPSLSQYLDTVVLVGHLTCENLLHAPDVLFWGPCRTWSHFEEEHEIECLHTKESATITIVKKMQEIWCILYKQLTDWKLTNN